MINDNTNFNIAFAFNFAQGQDKRREECINALQLIEWSFHMEKKGVIFFSCLVVGIDQAWNLKAEGCQLEVRVGECGLHRCHCTASQS